MPWVIATMVLHCTTTIGWTVIRRVGRHPLGLTPTVWLVAMPSAVGLVPVLGHYLWRVSRRRSTC